MLCWHAAAAVLCTYEAIQNGRRAFSGEILSFSIFLLKSFVIHQFRMNFNEEHVYKINFKFVLIIQVKIQDGRHWRT